MFCKIFHFGINMTIIGMYAFSTVFAQSVRTEHQIRFLSSNDNSKYIVLSAPDNLDTVSKFIIPPAPQDSGMFLISSNNGSMQWSQPQFVPVGTIHIFAGNDAPDGWLICNGNAVSREDYPELFEVISTTYGDGDGTTSFNLPNLEGKFPLGCNSSYIRGESGGEEEHTLTIDEIPSHNHILRADNNIGTIDAQGKLLAGGAGNFNKGNPVKSLKSNSLSMEGGSLSHNNMPPYLVLNFIIKYRAE